MNDLSIAPKDYKIPPRPNGLRGHRRIDNTIRVSKADFRYMSERHFKGRFTIFNRQVRSGSISQRLAFAIENYGDILLSIAQENRNTDSSDGSTWRTVKLLSAFKTADGKLCVIEIAPKEATND